MVENGVTYDWKWLKMVKYGLGWIETVDNDVKQLVENVWNFLKTVQNCAKCGRELGTTSGNTLGEIHGDITKGNRGEHREDSPEIT